MWNVVLFQNENTVAAVPSHWVKNSLCAWPKKDYKKYLERRVNPNKIEFDYYKTRVLKKDIGIYYLFYLWKPSLK